MRHASDFRETTRAGVRAVRPTLVLHARMASSPPSRVGFVVSKAVGNAVTRNRVRRRLRHLVVPLLNPQLPLDVVVRALPAAADDPQRLPTDLAQAWSKCLARLGAQGNVSADGNASAQGNRGAEGDTGSVAAGGDS